MRSVVVLGLAWSMSAAPGHAQAPAAPPAAPPPAQAAPAPLPPAVFPEGAKIGIVNLQLIAQLSVEGKAATARVQALIAKKESEGAAKAKQLQDNQAKLQQGGSLLNDAARLQLERDIEKAQVDAQRFQQDAEAEITELQTELQGDFQQKLFPILNEMVKEKGLHVLFSAQDAGVISGDPGIDLTQEAIKRFDAALSAPPAAAAPPAPAAKP
jgi:Skp family chaperone for outer membrane proteins